MGTAITTGRFARNGFIPWKQSGFYIISALIGSSIGASLALMLDDGIFKIIMLTVLAIFFVRILLELDF